MKKTANIVFLGLGSNLGDREAWMSKAREAISSYIGPVLKVSSLYETAPWGFNADQAFLNQVVTAETNLTPEELLTEIKKIEESCCRTREKESVYHSRTLDIDILYFGDLIYFSDNLAIPHPRMEYRRFVLQPLVETDPEFVHPILLKSNRELLDECADILDVVHFYSR
ncbi:MAG: 2-amino-4-hydroxy-6-hydroxymethyldihydropteridine diphosphokinase [Bacteroidales bacterium]